MANEDVVQEIEEEIKKAKGEPEDFEIGERRCRRKAGGKRRGRTRGRLWSKSSKKN
jgi:hypothetical protein